MDPPNDPVVEVLATYELLHMILMHIPVRNVAKLQPVCKAWKTVIERSKVFQQALFRISKDEIVRPSKLKIETIRNWTVATYAQKLEPNDFLWPMLSAVPVDTSPFEGRWFTSYSFTVYRKYGKQNNLWIQTRQSPFKKGVRVVAALEKMYLTQPPCTTVMLLLHWNKGKWGQKPEWNSEATLHDEAGVKIGMITEIVRQLMQQNDKAKVRDNWSVSLLFDFDSISNSEELEARGPFGRRDIWR